MAVAVRREGRWFRSWEAWVGDKDRLLRLSRVMTELIAQQRQAALDAAKERGQNRLHAEEEQGGSQSHLDEIKGWERIEADRLAEAWAVEMAWSERDLSLTHAGPPDQIVNEMDPAFVERVSIQAPKDILLPIQASIHLSRSNGCSVELRGQDPAWLRMARDTLSNEVQHGVPPWAWLRTIQAAFVYTGVIYVGLVVAAWNRVSGAWREKLIVSLLVGLPTVLGFSALLQPLVRRLLSGFEIIAPGAVPKSGRALGLVASVATSFILGIIVNLIT